MLRPASDSDSDSDETDATGPGGPPNPPAERKHVARGAWLLLGLILAALLSVWRCG